MTKATEATEATEAEPPSWFHPVGFLIGRNSRGNWVVQDQEGICGGLFVDRKAALRFAREENRYRPHTVVVTSNNLELDMTGKRRKPPRGADVELQKWRRSA